MGIIDRYLIGELYKAFLAVTLILVLIIFANNFVQSLEKIVGGYFSSDVLWLLLGFELLEALGFLIPPSFFFAILLSLGRLYRDSEIIAMQASGIGPLSIYRSYLIGALPATLLAAFLVMYSLPWAKYSMAQLEVEQRSDSIALGIIETGKFQELQQGKTVFFAESREKENNRISNIFVQDRRNDKLGIITAEAGYHTVDEATGDHYLVLQNGYRYTGEPGQSNYTTSHFNEYGILIRRVEQRAEMHIKAMPTESLWGSAVPEHRVEMQFRLSIPLTLLALTFLGIPLSRSLPRQSIYGRLMLAFITYFCFMNLHRLAHKWMQTGDSPLWMGMWWIPLLVIFTAMLIELRDRYAYLFNWQRIARVVKRL